MRDERRPLGEAYAAYFPIGAAIGSLEMPCEQRNLLRRHFTSLTAENGMKFEALQPEEGRFDFSYGDALADFARKNNQKLRGHTLVWHQQTPEWVFLDSKGEPASRALVMSRMEAHIDRVVRHFSDSVYCWDVVNEAIEDKESSLLRVSPWLDGIGEDYIGHAFELAHRAHAACRLFYNDYNNEKPEKCDKTFRLLRGLKSAGIPVDGVGIQGHFDIEDTQLISNLRTALERYAALNLQIQITELDVSVFSFLDARKDVHTPTADMLERQGDMYSQLFKMFRQYREVITGVTFWGISDLASWKDNFPVPGRKDWPLLFDVNFRPKAFYTRVVDF